MPVQPDFNPDNLYFITTTAVNRSHLFRRAVIKRIIVDSIDYMRVQQWLKLHVFVVMPNHVHLVVRFLHDHTLSSCIREFKKHTARHIVRQYQAEANREVLAILEGAAKQIQNQRFKVWEDGYDARDVFSLVFLRQKAAYCHNNPCQPHWALVDQPDQYPWSSARRYLLGEPAIIPVDNIGDWLM